MRGRDIIKRYGKGLAVLLICLLLVDSLSYITGMAAAPEEEERMLTVRATMLSGEVVESKGNSLLEALGGEAAGQVMRLEILSGTVTKEDWGAIRNFSQLTEFHAGGEVKGEEPNWPLNMDFDESYFPQSIQKIEIPEGVTKLGMQAFQNCVNLEEVKIPQSMRSIGSGAFMRCTKLAHIILPEGLRTINGSAFFHCYQLKEIRVPGTVTFIGTAVFWNCYELEQITLPDSLRQIGSIFNECKKMSRMNIVVSSQDNVTPVLADEDVFRNCPESRQVFFYNERGIPLSHATTPTLDRAAAAYRAVEDGDTSDTKWYGWEIGAEDPVYEVTVRTEGCGKTILKSAGTIIDPSENAVHEILARGETPLELTFVPENGCTLLSVTVDGEKVEVSSHTYLISDPEKNYSILVSFSEKSVLPTVEPTVSPSLEPSVTSEPEATEDPVSPPPESLSPKPPASQNPSTEAPAVPTPSAPGIESPPPADPSVSVPDEDISDIADGLGVPGGTAEKIQAAAKELDVSKDTILVTDRTITSQKTDRDIKGAYFARIQARASQITQNNVKLVWNKVKGADGYRIYGNRCNTKKWIYEYKLKKTIQNSGKKSYIERKCKKGTYYKFIVRAYKIIDGRKVTIAVSKTIHVITNGGKNGNAGSVKVNRSKISLKKGTTFRLKARELRKKKKLRHHREVCYESGSPKVASVNKKGVIRGKNKGKCTIFAYAQSGIYKKINVTVK